MQPDADPIELLRAWYGEAEEREPRVPDAACLATVGPDNRPSQRMVLIKEITDRGLVFYTNLGSRKARELAANPWCSVNLHWKSLERQVVVEGRAVQVSDETADAYFASRPRASRIGAYASRQSDPLESRAKLMERVARRAARFALGEVPRPEFWSGFEIIADRVELWQGKPSRLHERVEYRLAEDGSWSRSLLYP